LDRIQSNLLNDTLNLVQLARETARMQGSNSKAEKLNPVVNQLQTLVTNEQTRMPGEPTGIMAQTDFQTLLAVPQAKTSESTSPTLNERNQVISSLALGGMNEVDIARQMGMTRDEVRMFLNLNPGNTNGMSATSARR
jgi:hypothetical protein